MSLALVALLLAVCAGILTLWTVAIVADLVDQVHELEHRLKAWQHGAIPERLTRDIERDLERALKHQRLHYPRNVRPN